MQEAGCISTERENFGGIPIPKDFVLTARQRQVLELSMRGYNRRRIAQCLGIADYTVSEHFKNVYKKFRVKNRAAALAVALGHGLVANQYDQNGCPFCSLWKAGLIGAPPVAGLGHPSGQPAA